MSRRTRVRFPLPTTIMFKGLLLAALFGLAVHAATIPVMVGSNGFSFSPNSVMANVSDVIEFMFVGGVEHTVTESQGFSGACSASSPGFNSGAQSSGTYSVTINSTSPTYIYCQIHCSIYGMVFIANPMNPTDVNTLTDVAMGESTQVAPAAAAPTLPTVVYPAGVQPTTAVTPASTASSTGGAGRAVSVSMEMFVTTALFALSFIGGIMLL